jgi:hypothetical protein
MFHFTRAGDPVWNAWDCRTIAGIGQRICGNHSVVAVVEQVDTLISSSYCTFPFVGGVVLKAPFFEYPAVHGF